MTGLSATVRQWYAVHARELPWRGPGTTPWAVLVSEVMLQQTPVQRVLPVYASWIARWPTPEALAAAPTGDAVRQWGRLGYPRRALRLHEAARAIVDRHHGAVPADIDELLALPGVGAYTARAVASFAFGRRHPVVDTNVRRVVARAVAGAADRPPGSPARDLREVEPLLPADPAEAADFAAALMELGALVCTARTPHCEVCPLEATCRWRTAGHPAGPTGRRTQAWAGTDRQARGALLQALRASAGPVPVTSLDDAWSEPAQRTRALAGLQSDGLVELIGNDMVALPGTAQLA